MVTPPERPEAEISFQTWICPVCYDDHSSDRLRECVEKLRSRAEKAEAILRDLADADYMLESEAIRDGADLILLEFGKRAQDALAAPHDERSGTEGTDPERARTPMASGALRSRLREG